MREIATHALLVVTLLLPAATGRAAAQEPEEEASEHVPRISLGVYGGITTFGTFLEQRVGDREREITAESVPSAGVSLGYDPWRNTGLRVAVAWSPGELKFEDDTGDGGTTLDRSDVAGFDAFVVTLELVQFLLDDRKPVAPYAMGGLSWTAWRFDEATLADEAVVAPGGESTLTRFGETASVGLQIRPARDLAVRVELTTALLGNPFEGGEALRIPEGETISEPSRTSRRTLGIGLIYSFGGEEDDDGR